MARRPKKETLTEEQIKENELNRTLKDCKNAFINEPSIQYLVGEKVRFRRRGEGTIVDKLDGGKIYKLHVIDTEVKKKYNGEEEVITKEYDFYTCWHNLAPYRTKAQIESASILREEEDFRLSFFQTTVDELISTYYYNFGIDMNPFYQRGNVWTSNDKVALIDSIFKNIEIGKVVLLHLNYGGKYLYEILDGKQRLQTLVDFYEGKFRYKGKRIWDLHWEDRNHFLGYSLSFTRTEKEITDSQKLKYFLKLNSGGRLQDPEHMRKIEEMYERLRKSN